MLRFMLSFVWGFGCLGFVLGCGVDVDVCFRVDVCFDFDLGFSFCVSCDFGCDFDFVFCFRFDVYLRFEFDVGVCVEFDLNLKLMSVCALMFGLSPSPCIDIWWLFRC